jgi:hypothetical protein
MWPASGALRRVGDGFCRRAISPFGLNENAPVWLCLRQQLSSQPPTHRQAGSAMAKRRQGSQSQPAPAERQGGVLAKNSGPFCSPSLRRDTFLRRKAEIIVIFLAIFSGVLLRFEMLYQEMVMRRLNNKLIIFVVEAWMLLLSQPSARLPSPLCSPTPWRTRWRLPGYRGTPHSSSASPSSGGLMAMAGLENVAIYGRFRSSPAGVLGLELCRFLDAGNNEALGTLS